MDKGTIVRVLLFVLAWVNTFLASKGYETIPHVDETHVAMAVTFVISVWGFVKHNFFGKKGKAQKEAIKK
ncbi:phage holin [Neobacillus vireti]|uniref:phage holin n=1 Tax=Neobacillus vireti TaxID=220686 RepID=UPI002FFF56CC